ncbi:MAG: hypothetical protein ABJO67_06195 [Pseudoruegeria sp.]
MNYQVTLDYSIPFGELTPYVEALRKGKALASECAECGYVAFPARTNCGACEGENIRWKQLSGRARVLFRTDGLNGGFATVKFDGATTGSTVGLLNPDVKSSYATLVAPRGEAPGLWVELAEDYEKEKR